MRFNTIFLLLGSGLLFRPPYMAKIPLGSSRLDSTRSTLSSESSQSSESRPACRASRAVLFQHGGRRTSYSARL